MIEPTSHMDTFIRDNMPAPELWPEMDYRSCRSLRTTPPLLADVLIDQQVAAGYTDLRP